MAHYDDQYDATYVTGYVPKPSPTSPTPKPKLTPSAPVKSDGGPSSYYELTIKARDGSSFKCETGDVIRALVGNDFSLGNIIKACRRVSENIQGRGKEGANLSYDLEKIIYFAKEIRDHESRR